jgi:alkylation response protein AidB-like acyl-CoA dehydrogenase
MQFAFTNEQNLIRDAARKFFDEHGASPRVRAAVSSDPGYDMASWRLLSAEMGWGGIALAPKFGGAGLGWVELLLVQFEQGRRVFPSPFFSTLCLSAPLLESAGGPAAHSYLERIARGELRVASGLTGSKGGAGPAGVEAILEQKADGWSLSGCRSAMTSIKSSRRHAPMARPPIRSSGSASLKHTLA